MGEQFHRLGGDVPVIPMLHLGDHVALHPYADGDHGDLAVDLHHGLEGQLPLHRVGDSDLESGRLHPGAPEQAGAHGYLAGILRGDHLFGKGQGAHILGLQCSEIGLSDLHQAVPVAWLHIGRVPGLLVPRLCRLIRGEGRAGRGRCRQRDGQRQSGAGKLA